MGSGNVSSPWLRTAAQLRNGAESLGRLAIEAIQTPADMNDREAFVYDAARLAARYARQAEGLENGGGHDGCDCD